MSALPEVQTMTMLAYAGLDHHAYLRTTDPVERMVDVIVGERVKELRETYDKRLVEATGAQVGNRVGRVVGRALGEALRSIGRAMSRR